MNYLSQLTTFLILYTLSNSDYQKSLIFSIIIDLCSPNYQQYNNNNNNNNNNLFLPKPTLKYDSSLKHKHINYYHCNNNLSRYIKNINTSLDPNTDLTKISTHFYNVPTTFSNDKNNYTNACANNQSYLDNSTATPTNNQINSNKNTSTSTNNQSNLTKNTATSTNSQSNLNKNTANPTNSQSNLNKNIATSTNSQSNLTKNTATSTNSQINLNKNTATSTNSQINLNKNTATPTNSQSNLNKNIATSTNSQSNLTKNTATPTNSQSNLNKNTATPTNNYDNLYNSCDTNNHKEKKQITSSIKQLKKSDILKISKLKNISYKNDLPIHLPKIPLTFGRLPLLVGTCHVIDIFMGSLNFPYPINNVIITSNKIVINNNYLLADNFMGASSALFYFEGYLKTTFYTLEPNYSSKCMINSSYKDNIIYTPFTISKYLNIGYLLENERYLLENSELDITNFTYETSKELMKVNDFDKLSNSYNNCNLVITLDYSINIYSK